MSRRILTGFLLGLLVLTTAALMLARSVAMLSAERKLAQGARGELEALISFLATAEGAETGQRGYLLTGDTAYLAPYNDALRTMGDRVANLQALTANDPAQRAAVAALRSHVDVKMAELAETIRLRARSPQAAVALMRSGVGQREMAQIVATVDSLRREERRRLDTHLHAYSSGVIALMVHLAIAIGLQFVLLGILLVLTRRDQAFRAAATVRLTNEREFLRALLDSLSEAVVATGQDGLVTLSNHAFRDLFGTTVPTSALPLLRAARGERVAGVTLAGEATESGTRDLIANGQPILDAAGTPVGAVVAFRDTTRESLATAALQASEERFRRLSDAATDGVVVSRDGIILEVNAAWCRMCGVNESTLIGMPIVQLVSEEDREAVAGILCEHRTVTYALRWLRRHGTPFDGEVTARPIMYRGAPAQILVIRDVTEWTRVNRLKSEFVSTVSHELRTPLTSIHGALTLVGSGAVGVLSPKVAHLVTIARSNCERLVRLINEMLDLEKIEAGRLELRPILLDPADVVRSTVDGIRAMAEEYRMRLEERVDAPRTFVGDRDRIIQVLTNLVSNAIKFAPPDTVVAIAATCQTGEAQERVRFAVTNEGPGIQPTDVGRLFTRFQQLDGSDARHRGGTGLGLAISKAIVEQHGGAIGVHSEPGVATTFWFELPATRPTASLAELVR
ncbi:MAG TPA: CHASE3 domain-containing protein [Gemmatimonadaceae bacterium]|jgi:PAS domain S-box-containing protein|nr:CHASE3 domain-containing protein [Gemmatimonadaceae bacterium]